MCGQRGIYTHFIGGFVVILVIAVIAHTGALSKVPSLPFSGTPLSVQATEVPSYQVTVVTSSPTRIPELNLTPSATGSTVPDLLYEQPVDLPVRPPARAHGDFWASDIPLREASPSIPFAYIEESRGGLTQTFSVPYEAGC